MNVNPGLPPVTYAPLQINDVEVEASSDEEVSDDDNSEEDPTLQRALFASLEPPAPKQPLAAPTQNSDAGVDPGPP